MFMALVSRADTYFISEPTGSYGGRGFLLHAPSSTLTGGDTIEGWVLSLLATLNLRQILGSVGYSCGVVWCSNCASQGDFLTGYIYHQQVEALW